MLTLVINLHTIKHTEWNTLLHETFQLKKHVSNNSPVNRPVDPKQIATEIINTPAFSL